MYISQYFNLGSEQINSGLSVQSMVDRVNPLGMYLNQETGPVWVGIPLRVHRRCLNPMFSISNQIAYDGKMVLATGNPKRSMCNLRTVLFIALVLLKENTGCPNKESW